MKHFRYYYFILAYKLRNEQYELPSDIMAAPPLSVFRQRLKLFRRSYPDLLIWHSDTILTWFYK